MCATHWTDHSGVTGLRTARSHRAGAFRQGLATVRAEGTSAVERHRDPQNLWNDAGTDPLALEEKNAAPRPGPGDAAESLQSLERQSRERSAARSSRADED